MKTLVALLGLFTASFLPGGWGLTYIVRLFIGKEGNVENDCRVLPALQEKQSLL